MNLAANIAPHLPYLRRFSRALTGSQHSGDAYVAALLEALIADPAQFEGAPICGFRSIAAIAGCGNRSR